MPTPGKALQTDEITGQGRDEIDGVFDRRDRIFLTVHDEDGAHDAVQLRKEVEGCALALEEMSAHSRPADLVQHRVGKGPVSQLVEGKAPAGEHQGGGAGGGWAPNPPAPGGGR